MKSVISFKLMFYDCLPIIFLFFKLVYVHISTFKPTQSFTNTFSYNSCCIAIYTNMAMCEMGEMDIECW